MPTHVKESSKNQKTWGLHQSQIKGLDESKATLSEDKNTSLRPKAPKPSQPFGGDFGPSWKLWLSLAKINSKPGMRSLSGLVTANLQNST